MVALQLQLSFARYLDNFLYVIILFTLLRRSRPTQAAKASPSSSTEILWLHAAVPVQIWAMVVSITLLL
jgi:hypothetical protein